jgi:diguanylate cyclase (GGDEF)-like protein/PAS domain S-box-containing protein
METPLSQALPALAGSLSAGGAAEGLLRALTEHTPVGVFLSDTNGACKFVNHRWCELTGLTVDQALGDGWATALHPDDRERVQLEWSAAAEEERDSVISYRFRRPDGTDVWIDGYASAFHDSSGDLVGWVGACLDVSSHRRVQLALWTQAQTDSLTGLPNRRAFDELLEASIDNLPCGGEPFSLILLDIDHFKRVNDTYGHPAGDRALIAVAQTLQARLREGDHAVRLGGDEFAIVARTRNPRDLAVQLLAAIRDTRIDVGGHLVCVTASAGTASAENGANDPAGLIQGADHSLYRAKQRGRNCVEGDATPEAA